MTSRSGNPMRPTGQRTRLASGGIAGLALAVLLLGACSDSDENGVASDDSAASSSDTIELAVDESTSTRAESTEPTLGRATSAESELDSEVIELSHWEGVLSEGFTRTQEAEEECDNSDPDRLVCEWEMSFESISTHLGRAREVGTGTNTQLLSEACEGPDGTVGHLVANKGAGAITAAWGDELHFRLDSTFCTERAVGAQFPIYWRVVGGTGRFEDAYGVMSGVAGVPDPNYVSFSVGTLHVRADLWEDLLPSPAAGGEQ